MTPFTQRCVQDLAWVIQSPPLISGMIDKIQWWDNTQFQREYIACLPVLQQLDKDPAPLTLAIAAAKSQRLGHYFETLVAYWFTISPNYTLLRCNHQLRAAKKTLGELDFILQEKTSGKVIHLEVSVKFYLGTGDLNNMTNWHGPGLKDRLDRKFQHLRNHQTQLAQKYPELMPYTIDESASLMKGRLFYPPNAAPGTDFTSSAHLFGHWYELPDRPNGHADYVCLGKNRWLAEVAALGETTTLPDTVDAAALYVHCAQGVESARFFVLPVGFWGQL